MKTHGKAFYAKSEYRVKGQKTHRQRYWHKRKDGTKQRYWHTKKTRKTQWRKGGERITMWGTHRELEKAKEIMLKEELIPKEQYEDKVSAELFVRSKAYRMEHTRKGKWLAYEETEES